MRFSFSSEFLKILPPATNFGEAWEVLCLRLLRAELADKAIMRLGPPDRGIDIYRHKERSAYQCKSSERGIFGTIDAGECIDSLQRAFEVREQIPWELYSIALNAPLSGSGLAKILAFAVSKGLDAEALAILPHEYWSGLCERHEDIARPLFDYRVFVSEAEVIEAFRKARYYDRVVDEALSSIRTSPLKLKVSNNRTPVELILPFSGELTVRQLVHAVSGILGVSLDWANFPDLGTSCGPSVSMAVDRVPQKFDSKLSELSPQQLEKLQLWITLVWRDELEKEREHYDGTAVYRRLYLYTPDAGQQLARDRGRLTVERTQSVIQGKIWESLSRRA